MILISTIIFLNIFIFIIRYNKINEFNFLSRLDSDINKDFIIIPHKFRSIS